MTTKQRLKYSDGWHWVDDNDNYHREDGPAIINSNGIKAWYYKGQIVSVISQYDFERRVKLMAFE